MPGRRSSALAFHPLDTMLDSPGCQGHGAGLRFPGGRGMGRELGGRREGPGGPGWTRVDPKGVAHLSPGGRLPVGAVADALSGVSAGVRATAGSASAHGVGGPVQPQEQTEGSPGHRSPAARPAGSTGSLHGTTEPFRPQAEPSRPLGARTPPKARATRQTHQAQRDGERRRGPAERPRALRGSSGPWWVGMGLDVGTGRGPTAVAP